MRLPKFNYCSPVSLQEALTWLSENIDKNVSILAGGTDLLVDIRSKVIPDGHRPRCRQHRSGPWQARAKMERQVDSLMSLTRIPELRGISLNNNELRIGAMTTITELENSEIIQEKLPGLHDSAKQLGSPLVRNRGTYGGNLCNARPAADTAIPTLAGDGKLLAVSLRGERLIDHDDFVTGPGETILEPDEIVKEIIFDISGSVSSGSYIKLANRKALEIAVVGAAVHITFDSQGEKVLKVRIALGAVAPKPLLAVAAGEVLTGYELTDRKISEAAKAASQFARPITDHRGGAEYRRSMVEVLVRRALNICRQRIASTEVAQLC